MVRSWVAGRERGAAGASCELRADGHGRVLRPSSQSRHHSFGRRSSRFGSQSSAHLSIANETCVEQRKILSSADIRNEVFEDEHVMKIDALTSSSPSSFDCCI